MRNRNTISILLLIAMCSLMACSQSETSDQADTAAPVSFSMTAADSASVLAVLEQHHDIEYKSSAMGAFVTEIDGIKNADSGYWTYKVNDTAPQVAADKYMVTAGDTIVWIYQPLD